MPVGDCDYCDAKDALLYDVRDDDVDKRVCRHCIKKTPLPFGRISCAGCKKYNGPYTAALTMVFAAVICHDCAGVFDSARW